MFQSVNQSQFVDAFRNAGRENQFTYNGLIALHSFLEETEEETGTHIELDVIALCCDFTEYSDLEELQGDYSDIKSMQDLEDHTIVINIYSGGFIIQNF